MDIYLHKAEYLLLCGFFSWKMDPGDLWKNDEESKDLNIKKILTYQCIVFLSFKIIESEKLPLRY